MKFMCNIIMYTSFSPVQVPAPSITYSTLLAGTASNLTCDYSLNDFPHEASATWTVNGNEVTPNNRVLIDEVTLSFFPLNTLDHGRYSCELNITSLTSHVLVQGPQNKSDELPIAIESKLSTPVFRHLSIANLSSPST